jgi:HK97 family phage prohead protease
MDSTREYRVANETWPETDFEIRAEPTGLNFTGYAAVFDSWSEDLGGFRESIVHEAFDKTIRERSRTTSKPIKMFQNHNWDIVLASTFVPRGGEPTLRLSTSDKGLVPDADLPDNEWGRPVRDGVVRGDISSMSFGFNVVKDEWNPDHTERRLIEVKLWEVSPVTSWPAYPATSVGVRHLAELIEAAEDELETAVRVLFEDDGDLTDAQHDLLMRAIGARTTKSYIPQETHELLSRLMAKKPAA